MRVLILDTYYPAFLQSFYEQNSEVLRCSYAEQWRALMDQCFGTADFYSANLNRLGHEATEVVSNCEPLQRQWAKQNGLKLDGTGWTVVRRKGMIPWPQRQPKSDWFYTVLMAQVKQFSPDVLYVQDMNSLGVAFLRDARRYTKLIVGQIACPITPGVDFSQYDLLLSSLPHYVRRFTEQGLNSQSFRLAFDHSVLNRLTKRPDSYPVSHIGGYGPIHKERNSVLETVIVDGIPLTCWGYGVDYLEPNSPIRDHYQGESWGLDMYNIRYNSKIVVTKHISSVADSYANNMTLFEATGVGAMLLTDLKENLHEMFEPGKEVVTYSTSEECAELIRYYLDHSEEREAIASAGQKRTLSEHTYYGRMQELVEILERRL